MYFRLEDIDLEEEIWCTDSVPRLLADHIRREVGIVLGDEYVTGHPVQDFEANIRLIGKCPDYQDRRHYRFNAAKTFGK